MKLGAGAAVSLFSAVIGTQHIRHVPGYPKWNVPILARSHSLGLDTVHNEHPPTYVTFQGSQIELPKARSRGESAACVAAWRELRKTFDLKHFRQQPWSSNGEDLAVLDAFVAREPQGLVALWSDGRSRETTRIFMEMGAFDGVTESNTLLFERCMNWTGVMVEANPTMFKKLDHAGRTGAVLVHASTTCPPTVENGFGNETGTVMMDHGPWTSGMTLDIAKSMTPKKSDEKHFLPVPCTDLTAVLDRTVGAAGEAATRLPKHTPDLFFLDVEGSELKVLETLDLVRHPIQMVVAESENRLCTAICPKRDAVRVLMQQAGYALNPFKPPKSDVFQR